MKSLPLSYIRSQFELYGYGVTTEIRDPLWKGRAKYQTYPLRAGSHGFFTSKDDLITYLKQIERVRNF